MNSSAIFSDAHHFEHEAMRTTFTLRLRGLPADEASGMARECFDLVDSLEGRLSRFIEDSEISRINRMQAGETLYLSEATHQCLLLALDAYRSTCGLFDITLGSSIDHAKSGDTTPVPETGGRLVIHPDVPAVTCEQPGRLLDLGGIGKGFALDQLRILLDDWGAQDALLAAGASSLLAFGPTEWPVDLAAVGQFRRIQLTNQALSASGIGMQGAHIVHPAGEAAMPEQPCARVWVVASNAALAEVWSTALMLVPKEEIPAFIASEPGISGVYAECGGTLHVLR